MDVREDITRELLAGVAPYPLSKKYAKSTVYKIRDELIKSGQLPEPGVTVVYSETEPESRFPFTPATPTPTLSQPADQVATQVATKETGAETVDLGPKSLPEDAVNRIRGILGITARPKVLSMPMPELLYPAMVIAVTELGFQPMRPDDFIDTVLYQWLEACDYIPFAYIKKTELEGYAKKYGVVETKIIKGEGVNEQPVEGEVEGKAEEIEETEDENNEEGKDETTEINVEEPHKPTVGDLLKRLHIDNVRKEAENDSTGRTESISPQSGDEPGE